MRRLLWGVAALVVLAAACGRDGDDERTFGRLNDDVETVASSTTITPATDETAPQLPATDPTADDFVPQVVRTAPSAPRTGGATSPSPAPPSRTAAPGFGLPDPAPSDDNRWAVIIGISRYASPTHPTVGGAGDAVAFRQTLLDAGWRDDHIVVAVDREATGRNIRAAMDWLVARSNPASFSLFHYSGHVKQRGIGNEFLWGADNVHISNHEFGATMQQLQGHAWVDISGCEAAGFDVGVSSPQRLFSASSQVDEKSYEDPQVGMSVWTSLVVEQALRQTSGLSIQDALRYAQERAPDITAGQTPYGPQHPELRGPVGEEWNLRTVPGSPRPEPATAAAPSPSPAPPGDGGAGTGGGGGGGGTSTPPEECTVVSRLLGCRDS